MPPIQVLYEQNPSKTQKRGNTIYFLVWLHFLCGINELTHQQMYLYVLESPD